MIRNLLKENEAGENKDSTAKREVSTNPQTPETAQGMLFGVNIFGMCNKDRGRTMELLEMVTDAIREVRRPYAMSVSFSTLTEYWIHLAS